METSTNKKTRGWGELPTIRYPQNPGKRCINENPLRFYGKNGENGTEQPQPPRIPKWNAQLRTNRELSHQIMENSQHHRNIANTARQMESDAKIKAQIERIGEFRIIGDLPSVLQELGKSHRKQYADISELKVEMCPLYQTRTTYVGNRWPRRRNSSRLKTMPPRPRPG